MDLFALDRNFDRYDLVENFTSFIWTERYSSYGDFQIELPANARSYRAFTVGRYLHLPTSDRLMIMETVRRTKNKEGLSVMKVSGRSLETLMENRVVIHNETDGWRASGTIGHLATQLVNRICILGTERSTYDIIPNLSYVEPVQGSTFEEIQLQDVNLYSAVKALCDMDDFGFRIFFNPNNKNLSFRAYQGIDRTTSSNPVAFKPDLENLMDLSYVRHNVDWKNVAYVSHDNRTNVLIVYQKHWEEVEGIDRRVLMVNANDIENPTVNELRHRGRQELSKHNRVDLFDGEVMPSYSDTFRYGRDYHMGDIVSIEDGNGRTSRSRVVEYIRSYDSDGLRAYPTFRSLDD